MDPKAWPTSGQNVCRCCLAEGCYKDISTEYFWMGKREVYSDMLNETFDVNISFSKSGSTNSRLICEPCISRLRDASEFKKQVVDCERMFMNHLSEPGSSTMAEPLSTLTPDDVKVIKVEAVKQEKDSDGDEDFADTTDFLDDDDDDEDDLDNQPLTKFATKVPKKEAVDIMDLLDNTELTIKRKAPTKTKAVPAKKAKTTTKVTAKATVSKAKTAARPKTAAATKAVVEKKKKEPAECVYTARENALIVLKHTTAYPFRLIGANMVCVYCGNKYTEPTEYRQHMTTDHQKFNVKTAVAHYSKVKEEHIKTDCTDLRCRVCSQTLDTLSEASRHLKDSHGLHIDVSVEPGLSPHKFGNDRWICCICDVKLPTLFKLCRHVTSHYQKFTCHICGKAFIANGGLKYHIRYSHSEKPICRKCGKTFPDVEAKSLHVKNSKSCWTFCCVYCGDRFQSWESKLRHQESVHGKQKRNYPCSECEQVFQSRRAFYSHYKVAHTNDNFKCTKCNQVFYTKRLLEEHLVKHTGEKQHECPVCSKTFSRAKSLKQHMWIHNENKRFTCSSCGKQFAQKVCWIGHVRGHHPELLDAI